MPEGDATCVPRLGHRDDDPTGLDLVKDGVDVISNVLKHPRGALLELRQVAQTTSFIQATHAPKRVDKFR